MDEADDVCASCGKSECDDVKLKNCTACYLVKYCGVDCQREHRKRHKKECKKRVAELRDELLFKQPGSTHRGDCPICLLPIPCEKGCTVIYPCCSKFICHGCDHANTNREAEARLSSSCPFCRTPVPETDAEMILDHKKRAAKNDPNALHHVGCNYCSEGDYVTAIEYWEKGAQLGDIDSHNKLSIMYNNGHGCEKDVKKFIYHAEQAAIGGHFMARYNLAEWELMENRNIDRAVKHLTIAANHGYDPALETLKDCLAQGFVSKDDFTAALRAHKAAVDATKSPQRDAAKLERSKWDE